jgi:hypothetical protein
MSGIACAIPASDIFGAQAQARALLWQAGEIVELCDAVDPLVAYAADLGIDVDAAQEIMAAVFAAVRDDLIEEPIEEPIEDGAADGRDAPSWIEAAVEYAEARRASKRPLVVESDGGCLTRLRRLADNDVSLDAAWRTLNAGQGITQSTIDATLFVIQQRDPERLRQWLARHTPAERAALRELFLKMERAA